MKRSRSLKEHLPLDNLVFVLIGKASEIEGVAHKYAPRVDTKSIEAPVSRARSQSPGEAKEKECRDNYKVRA
jgi:hypothetical protein